MNFIPNDFNAKDTERAHRLISWLQERKYVMTSVDIKNHAPLLPMPDWKRTITMLRPGKNTGVVILPEMQAITIIAMVGGQTHVHLQASKVLFEDWDMLAVLLKEAEENYTSTVRNSPRTN